MDAQRRKPSASWEDNPETELAGTWIWDSRPPECEQNGGRNMTVKGHSGEVSEMRNRLLAVNWRKGSPCCKASNNLAELCSSVSWEVELTSHEIAYLVEGISKQNVEGVVWILLTAYTVT